jgi:hypothetical protein
LVNSNEGVLRTLAELGLEDVGGSSSYVIDQFIEAPLVSVKRRIRRRRKRLNELLTGCIEDCLNRIREGSLHPLDPPWWPFPSEFRSRTFDNSKMREATCSPAPAPAGERKLSSSGLYDICLALTAGRKIVGNGLDADGRDLIVITGANTGGKSTFLRSLALAQLMMQAGMFVPADRFSAEVCSGVFTHYRREEGVTMESSKLDEELGRMSDIVDRLTQMRWCCSMSPSLRQMNGKALEIACQITNALVERGIKLAFVTHLYEFAHDLCERRTKNAIFLRAERHTRRNTNIPNG